MFAKIEKETIFLKFFLKKIFFNFHFLGALIILSLFYVVLISGASLTLAFQWAIAGPIFILDLFILGIVFFDFSKSRKFLNDRQSHTFSILLCLLILNFLLMIVLIIWTWFFASIDQLKYFNHQDNPSNSYILDGIHSINWIFTYYLLILLAIFSLSFFKLLEKFFKKRKNYYFFILWILVVLLVAPISYIAFFPDYLLIPNPNDISQSNAIGSSTPTIYENHYAIKDNTLYLYPFFNNDLYHLQNWIWWIIIIDPLIIFMYLFGIATLNYSYNFSAQFFNNLNHLVNPVTNNLNVKTAYFHLELWSGYFWFMIYPYIYMIFLIILNILLNKFTRKIIPK